MDKMNKHEIIRQSVSRSYAQAVTTGHGCCGNASLPQGSLAKLAGYTLDELNSLPPEAMVSSFGCGNPLAFSEVHEGEVVLDLGSGAGIDLLLAAKMVGPSGRVIGVDMTDEMIAQARRNVTAAGLPNVEVRKGLIEQLPVESGTVDWVISNCVINLSPEKPKVFAEITRVLKPGGQLRISDIVAQDLPAWVRQDTTLYCNCVAGAISEDEYLQGLRDAGLREVAVRERLVYDASALLGLIACEPVAADRSAASDTTGAGSPQLLAADACCGSASAHPPLDERVAAALAGKVWSALFVAAK